jgi:hypothetical protein
MSLKGRRLAASRRTSEDWTYYLQTTAAALQVRRRPAPAGQALRGPATTCQPLRLRLAYLRSRLSALLVAMPWVTPCAVVVTNEQCRAWAGCGARLKAATALTATAASSNLVMALSSLRVIFSQLNIYQIYCPGAAQVSV